MFFSGNRWPAPGRLCAEVLRHEDWKATLWLSAKFWSQELLDSSVTLPFDGHHEKLWRDDGIYDLIIPLGYNDDPAIAGKGSAIFLHIMRPNGGPTEGCVALRLGDLLSLLAAADKNCRLIVHGPRL